MRRAVFLAGLCLFGCSKKVEEPNPAPRPSPPQPSSAASAPLSPQERKEIGYRLHNEACQEPIKHINVVNGRKETDPAGIDLLSLCIDRGNVAWSRCVMTAKTKDEVDACGTRLLLDAPR